MEAMGTAYLIVVLLAIILAICWIVLPFAVIGTKPLLKAILAEQRRMNSLLEQHLPDLRQR